MNRQSATRDEIEQLVDISPEAHAEIVRTHVYGTASIPMALGGYGVGLAGLTVALVAHRPAFLLLTVVGVGLLGAGFYLGFAEDEPFRTAVRAYNARSKAEARCPVQPPRLFGPY